jgi:hypothetical protein
MPPIFKYCRAVKAILYSPPSNNTQRQQGEGSYVAIFWNINLAPSQSRDSILFSLHVGQSHWRQPLQALSPVLQRASELHLITSIYTSNHRLCKQKLLFVSPVTQQTCIVAHWLSLTPIQNLLFPKLWHSTSSFFCIPTYFKFLKLGKNET